MASSEIPLGDQRWTDIGAALAAEFEALLHKAAASHRQADMAQRKPRGAWMMAYDEIGETAGTIWSTLAQDGPRTLGVLMEEVRVPDSLFFMAVGWLSREGKLEFEPTNGDYTVRLKQD